MFTWLKRYFARRAAKKRLERHFAQAEGSDFQRLCIAAAMSEIEDELVQQQRLQLSPADQLVFMITYECFVLWCLKRGVEDALKPEQTESAVVAIRRHFAKHASYQPEIFQKVWDAMQVSMPLAMKTTDDGCPPYPLAEMIVAGQVAGYSCDWAKLTALSFGMHVGWTFGTLVGLGRSWAAEFTGLSAETNAPFPALTNRQ